MEDLGHPTSYMAVAKGIPVLTVEGRKFGRVRKVLDVPVKNIFDGIIVVTEDGDRFLDAPEVDRLYERGVLTTLTDEQAAALPRPASPVSTKAQRVARRTWRKIAR
jgi:hypothetical protein